ncbi:MAG: hypothetical protein RL154_462 [Pseudomonadota bacterium]|jgi:hypothetical protein
MKTLVKNDVGGKLLTVALPCTASAAETFCSTFLVGTYDLFELKASGGTAAPVTAYKKVLVRIANTTTKESCYLGFCIPATKNETDIKTALLGKTFNGVKADELIVKFDTISAQP